MLKSDLCSSLSAKHSDIPKGLIKEGVDAIFERMSSALEDGGNVEIRGFGTFTLRELAKKAGRNPKSGEDVVVSERYKAHFKPGKVLKHRVNQSM